MCFPLLFQTRTTGGMKTHSCGFQMESNQIALIEHDFKLNTTWFCEFSKWDAGMGGGGVMFICCLPVAILKLGLIVGSSKTSSFFPKTLQKHIKWGIRLKMKTQKVLWCYFRVIITAWFHQLFQLYCRLLTNVTVKNEDFIRFICMYWFISRISFRTFDFCFVLELTPDDF